ncbi:hypothetical protein BJX99DRAFT_191333 [Aspergillus californicus]
MEHVSTLCAISTVGIAATGFALGRVERAQNQDPTHIQHTPLPVTDTSPSLQSPDPGPSKTLLTVETQSPINASFPHTRENANLYPNQVDDGSARRKTSIAGVILRRRGQTMTIPPIRTEEHPPTSSHSRRSSSSWIRRLSFQPEKRLSFQNNPASPSFPEPASPASSRPSSQRRAPNKLVKRPKSQHSNANPFLTNTVSSPLSPSGLRRPATSYQRSETFKHKANHSLSFEPSLVDPLVEPTVDIPPSENDSWQPYIAPDCDAEPERLDRGFSISTKPRDQSVRRIIPRIGAAPALLLATSITKKECAAEVTPSKLITEPPVVEFRDPFKAKGHTKTLSLDTETCRIPTEDACPKSPTESATPLDIRVFRNGSFTGPKRRAISSPIPSLPNMEGTILVSPQAHGRRNITDPSVFRRPPTTSNTGLSALFTSGVMGSQSKVISSCRREYTTDLNQYRYGDIGQSRPTDGSAFSSKPGSLRRRPKRHSLAASDPASTIIGSDDTRVFTSGDEDETDFLSDTAFDSIRTHITSNSSCFHSPRIEAIFDRTFAPDITDEPSTIPNNSIPPSSFAHPSIRPRDAGVKHEATVNYALTPVTRNLAEAHEGDSEISFPSDLSDDEDSGSMVASLPGDKINRPPLTLATFGALSLEDNHGIHGERDLSVTQSHHHLRESIEGGPNGFIEDDHNSSSRMNIFDWSEQSRPDREGTGPDGRPRTVHGKHGPGMRGSRAAGRKAPSTMHYRSQSVPVAREPAVANESRQSSGKFGTWGLGSKGVSEDWDNDFDFEDKDESASNENVKPSLEMNRRSVNIPEAIMERQASLHGQYGHVQELTLLVEELKRLRHQASFLDIVRGQSNDLWKEAEGIVDLATLDDDDNNHSPPKSPTSLTFSFDESEAESSNMNEPWRRLSGDSWRASFSENSNTHPTTSPSLDHTVLSTKANSVLDLIYQQRNTHGPSPNPPRSKKLPFDTQSLRDLVVRAGVVTRALKDVVRKAEGVTNGSSENTHPSHPSFSRIFEHPSHDDLSKFETSCIS